MTNVYLFKFSHLRFLCNAFHDFPCLVVAEIGQVRQPNDDFGHFGRVEWTLENVKPLQLHAAY